MKKSAVLIIMGLLLAGLSLPFSSSSLQKADASVGSYSTSASTYYNGITETSGTALLGQLHDLMTTTHQTYTAYDDCKTPTYILKTDPYGSDTSYVTEFYSQTAIASTWGAGANGTWNREHVWPQSLSNSLWGTTYGGSDLHHLRPAETRLNGIRGNYPYGEIANRDNYKTYTYDTSNQPTETLGGYCNSSVFEPLDSVKGDCARIVLYVYTHYSSVSNLGAGSSTDKSWYGALNITSIMSDSTKDDAFARLVSWNNSDPVDSRETTRNEAAAKYQGNRNPFIDHPEYVDAIWGDETAITLTMPSTASVEAGATTSVSATLSGASGTISYSSGDSSVATVDSSGTVTGVKAGNATITASITINGTVYSDTCLVTVTEPIAVTGLTMSKSTLALEVGASSLLTVASSPSGSSNEVEWSTSSSSIATVSSGTVHGVAKGTCTITATSTEDSSIKATCSVTVTESETGLPGCAEITHTTLGLNTTSYAANDGSHTDSSGYLFTTSNAMQNSSSIQIKKSSGYLYNSTAWAGNITSIVLKASSSGTCYLYFGTSSNPTTNQTTLSVTTTGTTYDIASLGSYSYFKIVGGSSAINLTSIYVHSDKDALAYSSGFVTALTDVCSGTQADIVPSAALVNAWNNQSSLWSSSLDSVDRSYITGKTPDEGGSSIEKALATYDYILSKYGTTSLSNYMGRAVTSPTGQSSTNPDSGYENILVISLSVSLAVLVSVSFIVYRKKSRA